VSWMDEADSLSFLLCKRHHASDIITLEHQRLTVANGEGIKKLNKPSESSDSGLGTFCQ